MPTANPLMIRDTINIAMLWTAVIIDDPMSHITQATNRLSLRPTLSLVKVENIEPSIEPPAMLAVIPPCVMEFGE